MKLHRFIPSIIPNTFLLLGLIGIWLAFAPAKLGGYTSYVIINGASMEPGFHTGDLVIVRKAIDYKVNDAVAYRDQQLQADVFHRIIAFDQDRFILKGDNNSWIDPYHPLKQDLIGKLWLHFPKLGKAVSWARNPYNLAAIAGTLGGLFMLSLLVRRPAHRKKNGEKPVMGKGVSGFFTLPVVILLILAVAFLVFGVVAFTRSLSRPVQTYAYIQSSRFSYSAPVSSEIYDSDQIDTGQPIFTKLTCSLTVKAQYQLIGDNLNNVIGSHQLYARIIDDQSGWARTLVLQPESVFNGSTVSTSTEIDLCQVQHMISEFEQNTGFRPGSLTLAIVSQINIVGELSQLPLSDTFTHRFDFKFDSVRFYLAAGSGSNADPLSKEVQSILTNPNVEPNTFDILGIEIPVWLFRWFCAAGFTACLAALVVSGWIYYDQARRSQGAKIQITYGSLIVEVYDRFIGSVAPVMDVTSMAELVKIAERQNTMILHTMRKDRYTAIHYYFVLTSEATYRFVISDKA